MHFRRRGRRTKSRPWSFTELIHCPGCEYFVCQLNRVTYILQDWIRDVGDLKGKSSADRPLTGKLAATEEKAKHERELRATFAVVAPGEGPSHFLPRL